MKKVTIGVYVITAAILFSGCLKKQENTEKLSLPPKTEEKIPAEAAKEPLKSTTEAAPSTPDSPKKETDVSSADTALKTENLVMRISGNVVAGKQSQVSFRVGGHIAKINVKVGDRVRANQVIAELDNTDFLLRQRLATAAVQQAKIQADQAQKDLIREEQLKKENVTSATSIERATNAHASAKIALETAQINLETAQKAVNDTKLVAPYEGIISKKFKSEGEFVGAGNMVFEIFEVGSMEISLKVPETFLKKISVGKILTVSNPATQLSAQVKVARIVPIVQEASRTFEVICNFVKNSTGIIPGQFVEAEISE